MANNIAMGQFTGPFKAKEDLYPRILEETKSDEQLLYVKHLGIQNSVSSYVYINGDRREIGRTGIYELTNTEIKSIYFEEDTDYDAIVDYIIEIYVDDSVEVVD